MKVTLEKFGDYALDVSVRDYFATKAMSCLMFERKHNWGSGGSLGKGWLEGVAKMSELAYEIADAMMEARKNDS